ncbi:MAG: hypothetical protein JNJ46_16910 [Myxococcales bacterium]|nr:hypothetical protein [Myxococcales bacterium]
MTDFLNRYMAEAWPDMVDTIRCEVISQARSVALDRGLSIPLEHVVTRLDAPPHFELVGNTLRGRMPATDAHQFSMGVHWRSGAIDIAVAVHVKLFAEMLIDQRQGAPAFTVTVGGDLVADIVDLTQYWKKQIQDTVTKGIGQQLGMFNTMRFDRSRVRSIPSPQLIHGHADLSKSGAIDIVLVSDGFSFSEMGQFRDVVTAIQSTLLEPSSTQLNEPYASFRSVIRLWAIEAPLDVPTGTATELVPLYRAVTGYHDPSTSSWKISWSNLAILDAIGSQASQFGADVIVFVTKKESLPDPGVRAAGVGPVILLPASASTATEDAITLLHELGHTRLGKLADEYSEGGFGEYRGPEPVAPNVSTVILPTAPPSTPKWPLWPLVPAARPVWDNQPISAVPGARYYQRGIYRPTQECKMRDSAKRFCAVCREAVTRQMRALLGPPEFLVECVEQGGGMTTRLRLTDAVQGGPYLGRVTAGRTMRVTLLSCPLPEPWGVRFSGSVLSNITGNACSFSLPAGEALTIKVASSCPFLPFSKLPSYELQLLGVEAAHPGPATPSKVNGTLASPFPRQGWWCVLQATTRNPDRDAVMFEFTVERTTPPNTTVRQSTIWLTPSSSTADVVGIVQMCLATGVYNVKARVRDKKGGSSEESGGSTFVVPPVPV